MKIHNLNDLPIIEDRKHDIDEDYIYWYLKSNGMEDIDADRAINDESHGLTMGIPNKRNTR